MWESRIYDPTLRNKVVNRKRLQDDINNGINRQLFRVANIRYLKLERKIWP